MLAQAALTEWTSEKEKINLVLARWPSWLELGPSHQEAAVGLIPGQGMHSRWPIGVSHVDVLAIKIFSGEDLLNK